MNNIQLHIINAPGTLDPFLKDIQEGFDYAVKIVEKKLPVKNVDIVVWENPYWSTQVYGFGGHTTTPHTVCISLDLKNPNIHKNFRKNYENTLAHELHHATRWQALQYPSFSTSRLEASIMEGLAQHFVMELTDAKPDIWDTALNAEELEKFVKIAKENKSTEDYEYYDWLFGNKEKGIPEWTGYSVGFYLVGEYLKKHPDKKASTLYATKEDEFIK